MNRPIHPMILTQDLSAVGKLSLSAALPIYAAAQVPVALLPTALLSTQTEGFGTPVQLSTHHWLQQTFNQWQTQGLHFSGISVGYLEDINLFPILINFISHQKLPLVIVDPVLGDNNQLYPQLNEDFISKMLQLCQWADVITPNWTELQLLIGKQVLVAHPSWSQVQNSILQLDQMLKHHTNIIVTGIPENQAVTTIWQFNHQFHKQNSSLRPGHFYGSGDVFTAVLGTLLWHKLDFNQAITLAIQEIGRALDDTIATNYERRFGISLKQLLKDLSNFSFKKY
ncbi:bifunctional hydroxymethylpyrimidine kinase/phosphomethylpyrimidine kinase [Bombilactobacillus mellis]|uniref:bifunctional hydroxymethylpyrimidine kinase/phosphomethylpyrimidine kinase n=1 Tax=Bombilactobacillus mellis TaxID=1218508 RepID=UPI0015810EE1|nr:bifunctional hydroxymethylpyrimidine kinase/phosphomethylpyrimidine kinase [Bombilactobacillus mellis]NUF24944.1 pyridoxal kinase [Bombilactobacillus mellis]